METKVFNILTSQDHPWQKLSPDKIFVGLYQPRYKLRVRFVQHRGLKHSERVGSVLKYCTASAELQTQANGTTLYSTRVDCRMLTSGWVIRRSSFSTSINTQDNISPDKRFQVPPSYISNLASIASSKVTTREISSSQTSHSLKTLQQRISNQNPCQNCSLETQQRQEFSFQKPRF